MDQARANMDSAQAGVVNAQANVQKALATVQAIQCVARQRQGYGDQGARWPLATGQGRRPIAAFTLGPGRASFPRKILDTAQETANAPAVADCRSPRRPNRTRPPKM